MIYDPHEFLCPGGTCENSPAFQRWDQGPNMPESRRDDRDARSLQSSLRDSSGSEPRPGVKTLGLFVYPSGIRSCCDIMPIPVIQIRVNDEFPRIFPAFKAR